MGGNDKPYKANPYTQSVYGKAEATSEYIYITGGMEGYKNIHSNSNNTCTKGKGKGNAEDTCTLGQAETEPKALRKR